MPVMRYCAGQQLVRGWARLRLAPRGGQLVVLLVLPIAFGVAAIDGVRSEGSQDSGQSELAKE